MWTTNDIAAWLGVGAEQGRRIVSHPDPPGPPSTNQSFLFINLHFRTGSGSSNHRGRAAAHGHRGRHDRPLAVAGTVQCRIGSAESLLISGGGESHGASAGVGGRFSVPVLNLDGY
ncbi:hypothetical protein FMEAI12_7120001 [Parafrankia sp. Ea1.12]|nr:hypothetical protein FMEAI12_7120001 [Parafrankia sp. Ea1.12]